MIKTLTVAASLALGAGAVNAASISQDGTMIYLSGPIEEGDAETLYAMAESSGITQVTLESDGGLATEGYNLGYAIRELGMGTYVVEGTSCLSACAVAFLGGDTKSVDGLLGFHIAWSTQEGTYSDGMKGGQILGTINAAYFFDMGYTIQLPYVVAYVTDSEHFLLLSEADLEFFEMIEKEYTLFKPLGGSWIADRMAGPLRLQLLRMDL